MQPKAQYIELFPQAAASHPGVIRVLESYETRLSAAPVWLGDFALKAWNLPDIPSPLHSLAARMVAKARDCVWALPAQSRTLGGYNTLYLQRYFKGQRVNPHKDPQNNRHSVLILSLGAFDPPKHTINGQDYTLPTGTLLHFSSWFQTPHEIWVSPEHGVGPLPEGERWALILTLNDHR
jgi:hypothetical protein